MRLRRFLIPSLLAGSLIPLAIPYLQSGYQYAHDRAVPYLRVQALHRALSEGQFPPRWFPDFDGGYGSPYPSFYGMFFYYVATALGFAGLSIPTAVELAAFLVLAGSGVATFVFVRRMWGSWGALLSAILYLYAPYHLVDAYVRGAFSELTAFLWFPAILFCLMGWIDSGRLRYWAGSVLTISALLLSHNLMPLVFLPLAGVWAACFLAATPPPPGAARQRLGGLLGIAFSSLGVAAYLWLPIFCDRELIRAEYFLQFDVRDALVPLGRLLDPRPPHSLTHAIGLVLFAAAALAAALVLTRWKQLPARHRLQILIPCLLGLGLLVLIHPSSKPLWTAIAPLRYMQFPWRLLAPASFFLAVAAGALPTLLPGRSLAIITTVGLSLIAIVLHSPLVAIPVSVQTVQLDSESLRAEVWGTQDYRPRWSKTKFWGGPEPPKNIPAANMILPRDARSGPLVDRGVFGRMAVDESGSHWRIGYSAFAPACLEIPQFYYPGWEARLDRRPLELRPGPDRGLLMACVPEGEHTLDVRYRGTLAERVGGWISLLALALSGGWILRAHSAGELPGGRDRAHGDTAGGEQH